MEGYEIAEKLMANLDLSGFCPWDPNSFARPDQLAVADMHLEWTVDFEDHRLIGTVDLNVKRLKTNIDILYLDTRDLEISAVGQMTETIADDIDIPIIPLNFNLGDTHPVYGRRLEIQLPNGTDESYWLKVSYRTSPKSSALQWLQPEQTAGKTHPYLFSQCEPIHARSMLPCQDTPAVKTTYSAKVVAPKGMTVLMSALRQDRPKIMNDEGGTQFTFRQMNCLPSYLIAVVVGALDNRRISDRIDVWSEKEIVDKAAYEFAEAEIMLKTAEEIAGPYLWGRYDILVLPPSFPFGGMENPCLTFVTPTLLAGDRSQANVVAHEIAHSWTGNLVTNKNFEHFWLNEGFTVFLERKIGGRMFGEKYRQFVSIGGWKELKDVIRTLGETNPLTQLVVDLKDVDPDDAFSTVPYEKGYAFLYFLEQKFGGPSVFEPFLRSYIESHKFTSIDTDTFKQYLLQYFKVDETDVDWNKWLYQPGMPPETNAYDTSTEDAIRKLSQRWLQSEDTDSFSAADLADMSPIEIQEFLASLLENKHTFPIDKLEAMEAAYKFNSAMNSEIRLRWLRLCLENYWTPAIELAFRFINEQGRMKYVRPIYRALYEWEEVRPLAIANFKLHYDEMMYMSAHCVAKELHLN